MKKNIPFFIAVLLMSALIITRCGTKTGQSVQENKLVMGTSPIPAANQKVITVPPSDSTTYVTITYTQAAPVITTSLTYDYTPPVVVVPPTTSANILFQSTFDDSLPFSAFYSPTQSCCSYSITTSSNQARAGTKSARFELNASDAPFAGAVRAELYPKITSKENDENWLGLSYYFPSSTMGADAVYDLIAQWHPNSANGSPPFSLRLQNGFWYVAIYTGNALGGNPDNAQFNWVKLSAYSMDKWNDVVIHYKQRSDATGLIEIWINSTLIWIYSGINSFVGYSNYLKIGDNKSPWPGNQTTGTNAGKKRIFYIDNVKYANEKSYYNEVTP